MTWSGKVWLGRAGFGEARPGAVGYHDPLSFFSLLFSENYRRFEHLAGVRVTVAADVPADVATRIRTAGLSPVEVGAIVAAGLRGRA